ncbi:hypothetical protein DPMN_106399 [Dreissena polymorpha]|uniref:Uncharacterized protein n=1 Tax=Dreissena polymorpha TaxID=45954 RepID=A0A9D4QIG3_DREPO|nr:hypothetical protein DPMN_106399 [Dreissena polymorpha]
MDDIGVSEDIIQFRRQSCLFQESFNSWKEVTYIFGSQSEGSTTLGMESDHDTLQLCYRNIYVGLDFSDMRMENLNHLLVQTLLNLPQCCSLQKVGSRVDTDKYLYWGPSPEPQSDYIIDSDGRLVLSSLAFIPTEAEDFGTAMDIVVDYHGPAINTF